MSARYRIIIGSVLIAAITGYVVVAGTASSWQYYVTVEECLDDAAQLVGKRLRVHGTVAVGSLQIADDRASGTFSLDGIPIDLPVRSECYLPDSLREGVEVVAEGTLDAHRQFHATQVLTRCASKYASESTPQPTSASRGEIRP